MLTNVFGSQDVRAAQGFLACADLACQARRLTTQHSHVPDLFTPLLDSAQRLIPPCTCEADHHPQRQAFSVEELLAHDALGAGAPFTPRRAVDFVFTSLAATGSCPTAPLTIAWAWDVTRALLGTPRHVTHRQSFPVAGTSDTGGFLATLELELVEPGCGETFHAPEEVFHTRANARFVRAMQDAWDGACILAQQHGAETRKSDGRWRLQVGSAPAAYAEDRSASGAAARGWWYVLTGRVADEGLIVVAQVDTEAVTQLRGVDGVCAKTQAIAQAGYLDTIVVAAANNQHEAEEALRQQGQWPRMRVLNMTSGNAIQRTASPATLTALVNLRDQFSMGLMAYLRALMALPEQRGPSYIGTRRVTDLYIAPDVVPVETAEPPPGRMPWEHAWTLLNREWSWRIQG